MGLIQESFGSFDFAKYGGGTYQAPRHFLEDNNLPYREDSYRLVNGEDFLTVFEGHVPTYACVDAIARNCAKVPMRLYNSDKLHNGVKKPQAEITNTTKDDEVGLALWKLFNYPNPWQSNFEFRYAIMATAELTGMTYVEKTIGSTAGQGNSQVPSLGTVLPEQLWVLRTDWMRAIPSQRSLVEKYNYQTSSGAYVEYLRDEIFEYKYWHPRSEFYGLSPIRPAQNSVIIDLYAIKYAKQFFKNGGHISKYVSIKEKLGEQEFKRMASEIQTFMGGLENAHKIPLLEGGGELKEIGENPEGAALPKTRSMVLDDVCQAFGVPPIILGLPNTTHYNNADAQKKVFYEETVIPKNYKLLTAINQAFLEPLGYIMDYDYADVDVLQPNLEKKASTSLKLVAGHIFTPNEVRQRLWDADPYEGGDVFPTDTTNAAGSIGTEEFGGANPEVKSAGRSGRSSLDPDTMDMIDKMVDIKLGKALRKADALAGGGPMNGLPTGGQGGATMTEDNHSDWIPNNTIPTRRYPGSKGVGRPGTPQRGRYHKSIKKAAVANHDKLHNMIYPAMESAVLNGWKSAKKEVVNAIHSFKKSAILIRKDYVNEVLGIFDNETLKMAKELTSLSQDQVDKIIAAESVRTGRTIPKSQLAIVQQSTKDYLAKSIENGFKSVSKTQQDRIRKHIDDSIDAGNSPAETADIIDSYMSNDDYAYPKMVARTETLKALNGTKARVLEGMGFKKKQWFHSGHENAREDHLAADGEVVPIEDQFSTGLMYPGDPAGDAEDVINCGCTFNEYVERISDREAAELGGYDEGDE